MYNDLPLHDAYRTLHQCGWNCFEISSEHLICLESAPDREQLVEQANACLCELGASSPQAHGMLGAQVAHPDDSIRENHLQRLEEHIRIAARLGVRVIVIHPSSLRSSTSNEQDACIRQLNVDAFRRLGDCAGEQGMRIAMENLMSRGAGTAAEMLDLIGAIGHPAIGIALDTSHANVMQLDIPAAIRDLGKHIIGTHISDNNQSGDQHLLPGRGTVDWPGVMAALGAVGYNALFNFEIPGERHPIAAFHRLNTIHARGLADCLLAIRHPDCQNSSAV